ncbi:PAS domain-containing protein [Aggregatimonas sangjinii]|uniref:histidine kinase n=1 Tax=Aggregatimonas sangjinii TaxID=2583587 RepID=A0A5B7SY74_9FLAO|nr:type IV pili methyl-accepting chemotaxis transducer N-terminal domain-containing protein [Aggregatimonas sangjinii]QCX01714.1 PAS domain-containing protein [Aggregatimonas sangjinii]
MPDSKHEKPLDTTTFLRIRKWYLLALAGIALTIIVAQLLIQTHLNSQLNDSRVINVAGRQRAFSQKLVKEVLLLEEATKSEEYRQIRSEIERTVSIWKTSHEGLQKGNSDMNLPKEEDPEILSLFQNIDRHHRAMVNATEAILAKEPATVDFNKEKRILLENERDFLRLMDNIVNKYDERSNAKLQNLKQKEYFLLAFSLLILLLEMVFIFRPLSVQIRKTISNLMKTQLESDDSALKIKTLLREKEKSLQELQELNFVIDNAALFASARKDGSIVFISKKFLHLLGLSREELNKPLSELLTTDEGQQRYLKELLKSNRKNTIRSEEIAITTNAGQEFWLDISIIPMHQASKQQSILILCSDITERKKNLLKVEHLTQQNFEERMLQKKQQASQIVEGQEEERKRIAKDIHDGIGQMLTALKFNIESIDVQDTEKTKEKIAYLKGLTSDLIKGVRTATFNLTPPELSDHGIFPALHKMTVELSKLTGKRILFENKAVENIRFDSLAETNMYRVTQEAVNNAIKYAKANYILVTINFKEDILSIVIDDDGKGFDTAILGKVPNNNSEGGMGLFFMRERISYINGRLFIHSEPGKGTRVTINYRTDKPTEERLTTVGKAL